jgi:toxin YhaV
LSSTPPLIINGWNILAHPLFLNQLDSLLLEVERLREKYPDSYQTKNATKRLAAIYQLAFSVIPDDPTRSEYRQGNTLGNNYKHWFRAKFFQQYRLFFRYHTQHRIILYAWVNDTRSLRAYGAKTDAYRVFQNMLKAGNPPDSWNTLLEQARLESNRLQQIIPQSPD